MRNGTGIFFLSTCRPRVCSGISEDAQLRRCRPDRWLRGDSMRPSKAPDQVDIMTLVGGDRKSTRLNSSHVEISYAVFCLKKKKKKKNNNKQNKSRKPSKNNIV